MRVPRSTVYRIDAHRRRLTVTPVVRSPQPAPPTIYATLLDEGTYLGSVRTLYRLLAAGGQARERRNQHGLAGTRVLSIDSITGVGASLVNYSGQGLTEAWVRRLSVNPFLSPRHLRC